MPSRNDLPRFRPGQQSISARSLNALSELAAQISRNGQWVAPRPTQHIVVAQADIGKGSKGSVKYAYWDDDTSSFATRGDAFDAVNIGPDDISTGDRAVLAIGERQIPFFQFAASAATDLVSSSSSSNSSSSASGSASYSSNSFSSSSSSSSTETPGSGDTYHPGDGTDKAASFTEDGTWRDLDLSSETSSSAKLIFICLEATASPYPAEAQFRADGGSTTVVQYEISDTQTLQVTLAVPATDGVIEYNIESAGTVVRAIVSGYFE